MQDVKKQPTTIAEPGTGITRSVYTAGEEVVVVLEVAMLVEVKVLPRTSVQTTRQDMNI